jgi:hypothetical protein
MLPFTTEQFFAVFAAYNGAVWPASIAAYVLGAAAVVLAMRGGSVNSRIVAAILALMWAWTGVAYHMGFFSAINRAAWIFGALFAAEALLLLYYGAYRNRLNFGAAFNLRSGAGYLLIGYAAIAYPLIGIALGHDYMELPQFGVTPCPVALFTFGLILLARGPIPWPVLVIPVLWSLIGGSAAILLNVPQDWALLVSGLATLALLVLAKPRSTTQTAHLGKK